MLANPALLPMLARAAVAETMVQMECDYVTPSFFRELEKEYQSGLRRCGAGRWCCWVLVVVLPLGAGWRRRAALACKLALQPAVQQNPSARTKTSCPACLQRDPGQPAVWRLPLERAGGVAALREHTWGRISP